MQVRLIEKEYREPDKVDRAPICILSILLLICGFISGIVFLVIVFLFLLTTFFGNH